MTRIHILSHLQTQKIKNGTQQYDPWWGLGVFIALHCVLQKLLAFS